MPAKESKVSFTLKIGAEWAGVFAEATGLHSESAVSAIKRSMPPGRTDVIKALGMNESGDIELKRGVDRDRSLRNWRKLVTAGKLEAARKDCTVTLDYEGRPLVTFAISNAWPKKYTDAGPTAHSRDVAVEGLTLCHEGFELRS